MRGSYAAELVKIRKRGAMWVLLGAALIVTLIFGYVLPYIGYLTGEDNPQTSGTPRAEVLAGMMPDGALSNALGGIPVVAGALALTFGALVAGGEYGWGTLKTVFTQGPGRLTVVAAQLAALVTAMLAWVVVDIAMCALASVGVATMENQTMSWPGGTDIGTAVGIGWLTMSVWAVIGALLAIALRTVALPIGLGLVWILGVETLLNGVVGSVLPDLETVTDVMPGVNVGALVYAVAAGAPDAGAPGVTDAVSGTRALLTLVAYLAVAAAASGVLVRRRDAL